MCLKQLTGRNVQSYFPSLLCLPPSKFVTILFDYFSHSTVFGREKTCISFKIKMKLISFSLDRSDSIIVSTISVP